MASPAKLLTDWICEELVAVSWITGVDRDFRADPLHTPPCAKVIKTTEQRRTGTPRIIRDYTWDIYLFLPGIQKIDENSNNDDLVEQIRLLFEGRDGVFPFFGIAPDETKYVGFRVDNVTTLGRGSKTSKVLYLLQISLPVIPAEFRAR